MKLTCSRRDLHEAVQTVARAAATQTALPILNHVLLTMERDRLHLVATDNDLASRTSIQVSGSLQEGIAVPAKILGEILGTLPEGEVELETGGRNSMVVRQGEIRFDLRGLPPEEFPSIPVVHLPGDDAVMIRLSQATMRRLLRQTLFCVSQDPTRPQYTGILFEREGQSFRLASTDGVVRVAVSSIQEPETGAPVAAIVPARTAQELVRILRQDSDAVVVIYIRSDFSGPTLASFEANGVTLVTRLIEGQFAPWRRVVPAHWDKRATVKSSEILGALKRMAIVGSDDQQRVQFTLGEDSLQMSCHSNMLGDAEEKIPSLVEGGDLLIALHGRFLAEGIGALEEEGCRVEMTSSLSPCVVRPLEGENYLYVQSPMHPR